MRIDQLPVASSVINTDTLPVNQGGATSQVSIGNLTNSIRDDVYGAPLTASTSSAMTDQTRVYVYTGTTGGGFTNGHWYYYNGSAWTDGGVYNSSAVQTDTTLTLVGVPADAAAVGGELTDLKSALKETIGYELLNLFENVTSYKSLNGTTKNVALTGCTASSDGKEITLTASAATVRFGSAGRPGDTFDSWGHGYPIPCHGKAKLHFIVSNPAFHKNYVTFWGSTGVCISATSVQTDDFVLDIPVDAYYCSLRIDKTDATTGTSYTFSVRVYEEPVETESVNDKILGIKSDLSYFEKVEYSVAGGYLSSNGSVIDPSATQMEVFSDFIPADKNDIFELLLANGSSVAMWAAYAEYDKNLQFIARNNLINATYSSTSVRFTVQDANTKFIAITYRTYGTIAATLRTLKNAGILYDKVGDLKTIPFTESNVKAINHRGFNSIAPENTLPAFVLSSQHGYKYVETDVSLTSDGVAVLLHDATINRTARNADGSSISSTVNISDITYAQALEYDFGIYKGTAYAGTKIPTLAEFFKLCKRMNLRPYVELKNTATYTQEQITSFVSLAKSYGMLLKTTWISFSITYLQYVLSADSGARVGYVADGAYSTKISEAVSLMTSTNDVFLDAYAGNIATSNIEACITNNLPVELWTVNANSAIAGIHDYVTGITTDYADVNYILYYSQYC